MACNITLGQIETEDTITANCLQTTTHDVLMSHCSSLAYLSSWTVLGQNQKIEDQDTESIIPHEDNDDRLNCTMLHTYNSLVWLTQVL